MSRNKTYIKLINSIQWRKLRARKLSANPLCEECERRGISTIATEVHHNTPVESIASDKGMENLMFGFSNLMSLCHVCHSNIHTQSFSHSKESVKANRDRETQRFINTFLLNK